MSPMNGNGELTGSGITLPTGQNGDRSDRRHAETATT